MVLTLTKKSYNIAKKNKRDWAIHNIIYVQKRTPKVGKCEVAKSSNSTKDVFIFTVK